MLLSYNFMNKDEAEKVLAACKEEQCRHHRHEDRARRPRVDPFDPENPTEE